MRYEVLITRSAERDLEQLVDYIAERDAPAKADHVLAKLLDVIAGLANFPERGTYARELLTLGIREFRQVSFKPYRVIYRVAGRQVFIMVIVDGRRDLQALLARRLLSD